MGLTADALIGQKLWYVRETCLRSLLNYVEVVRIGLDGCYVCSVGYSLKNTRFTPYSCLFVDKEEALTYMKELNETYHRPKVSLQNDIDVIDRLITPSKSVISDKEKKEERQRIKINKQRRLSRHLKIFQKEKTITLQTKPKQYCYYVKSPHFKDIENHIYLVLVQPVKNNCNFRQITFSDGRIEIVPKHNIFSTKSSLLKKHRQYLLDQEKKIADIALRKKTVKETLRLMYPVR
jgi:hypothetical protein